MSQIKLKYQVSPQATATEIFQTLLNARGLTTQTAVDSFLNPPAPTLAYALNESGLTSASLDQAKAVIDTHLHLSHDIVVFGDYDADGVSATAVMWQALVAYGKISKSSSRILPFVPDRHRHGYGLGELAVDEVATGVAFKDTSFYDFAPKLIITVDTGIVAHVGIKSFVDHGIDVVITDHHLPAQAGQPDNSLPPAQAIVHSTATSGAGIAYIFALYLLGDVATSLLDLATIGIVGDMMPTTGLNRSLIKYGLAQLTKSTRPGVKAIKAAMGITDKSLTTYDISFGIAPRINAAGRIYNPTDALRLLCTSDQSQAQALAEQIESHNKDRQSFTDQALEHATNQSDSHNILVIIGNYHEGVIGLVAGKLVEKNAKPAVVMSDNGEVIKGSARSIPGVNITEILRSLKTPFLGLGGHEQAAGFSIAHDQVASLTSELQLLGDQLISPNLLVKQESADLKIELAQATLDLAKLIPKLEPFGLGNHKPKFLIDNLDVLEDRPLGVAGRHHKLLVSQAGLTREVLIFNTAHQHPVTHINHLICNLDINVWKERESLQLIASYVEI